MRDEMRDAGGGEGQGEAAAKSEGGGEWRRRLARGLSGARRAMERAVHMYRQRAKARAEREAAASGTTVAAQRAAQKLERQRERRELREQAVEAEMERERQAEAREWEERRGVARRAAVAAQETAEAATAATAERDLLDYFARRHWLQLPLAMWAGRKDSKREVTCRIMEIVGDTRDHEHMEFRVQSAPGEPWWPPWWTTWATVVGRTRHGTHQMAARLVPREEAEGGGSEGDASEGEDGDGGAEHERAARRRAMCKLGRAAAAARRAEAREEMEALAAVEAEAAREGGPAVRRRRTAGDGRMGPTAREWYAAGGTGWRGGGGGGAGRAEREGEQEGEEEGEAREETKAARRERGAVSTATACAVAAARIAQRRRVAGTMQLHPQPGVPGHTEGEEQGDPTTASGPGEPPVTEPSVKFTVAGSRRPLTWDTGAGAGVGPLAITRDSGPYGNPFQMPRGVAGEGYRAEVCEAHAEWMRLGDVPAAEIKWGPGGRQPRIMRQDGTAFSAEIGVPSTHALKTGNAVREALRAHLNSEIGSNGRVKIHTVRFVCSGTCGQGRQCHGDNLAAVGRELVAEYDTLGLAAQEPGVPLQQQASAQRRRPMTHEAEVRERGAGDAGEAAGRAAKRPGPAVGGGARKMAGPSVVAAPPDPERDAARARRFEAEGSKPPPPLPARRLAHPGGKIVTSNKAAVLDAFLKRKARAGVTLTEDQQRARRRLEGSSEGSEVEASAGAAEASDGEEEAEEGDEAGTSAGEGAAMAAEEGECAPPAPSQRPTEAAEAAAPVQEAEVVDRASVPAEAEEADTTAAAEGAEQGESSTDGAPAARASDPTAHEPAHELAHDTSGDRRKRGAATRQKQGRQEAATRGRRSSHRRRD